MMDNKIGYLAYGVGELDPDRYERYQNYQEVEPQQEVQRSELHPLFAGICNLHFGVGGNHENGNAV